MPGVRRLALLAGALAVPAVPLLVAAPAYAADHIICVGVAGVCDESAGSIQAAITIANGNGLDNTILFGGTHSDGPYVLNGSVHGLTLWGTGSDAVITLPPGGTQDYINATDATVRNLVVQMNGTTSDGDVGLRLSGSVADHVTVDGSTVVNARAGSAGNSTITNSEFLTPAAELPGSTALSSSGGNTVTDTSLTGSVGLNLSDPGTVDTVSRVSIRADGTGVTTDGGTVNIDDAVIDLGTSTSGTGLAALNFNNGIAAKTINANHVTVVGGGAASRGAWAYAAATGAKTTSTVTLANSIVRGPATSLVADAGNDGAQGGPSTATVTVSYSDYKNTGGTIGANGAGGVVPGAGNVIDVDPLFVNAAGGDFHLTQGSTLVDKGDPAAGGPALDRDGTARVVDGDAVPGAVRDMGAYEVHDSTPPDTTIDSGPSGPTADSTPTFTFSSEPGASYECQVDALAETACSSPLTLSPLLDGVHTLSVTATDAASNPDPTPATRTFSVDTVAPDTTIATGPSGLTADSTPTFTFSSEPGVTFECRVDTAAFTACASPFTASSLSDGAHTFTVRAKDVATNVDTTPATRSVTIDTTGPETTITKPAKRTTKKKVKLVFSSEAGASFECQVDGKAWKACTSPLKLKVKLGKHVVLVRAVDAAGNVEATPAKVKFRRVPKP